MKAVLRSALLFGGLAAAPAFAQTPYLVKDILPGEQGSAPLDFVGVGNQALFLASYATPSVWVTDGTAANTQPLLPSPAGDSLRGPFLFTSVGARACFGTRGVFTPPPHPHFWCTDGTSAGTYVVSPDSLNEFFQDPVTRSFPTLGSAVFFIAQRSPYGRFSLWKSDGTPTGTTKVVDLPYRDGNYAPIRLAATTNRLYFFYLDEARGADLWTSDGTANGTYVLASGIPSNGVLSLIPFGDRMIFSGYTTSTGYEPWITDGTVAGTRLIRELTPGEHGSFTNRVQPYFDGSSAVLDGSAYFGSLGDAGAELWKTDGTAEGTVRFDLCPGTCSSEPKQIRAANGRIYFSATDGVHGREPWHTQGVTQAPQMISDLVWGSGDSYAGEFTAAGDKVYFTADGKLFVLEPGNFPAEVPLKQGSEMASFPLRLQVVGTTLYFTANVPSTGAELWAISNVVTSASEPEASASALALRTVGARSVELTATAGAVRVEAFDLLGRRVATLHDGDASGTLRLALPPSLGVGAYVVRATADSGQTASALVRAR